MGWRAMQVAAEKKRRAEEREARARQLQERRAAEDAEDRAAAQQRAAQLRNAVAYHREGQRLRGAPYGTHCSLKLQYVRKFLHAPCEPAVTEQAL